MQSIKKHIKTPIYELSDSFYAGMRGITNLKTLKVLEQLTKTITNPTLFGGFENDSHYAQTFELLLKSTNEERQIGLFIKRVILPNLKNRDKLLDIGPGKGELTKWIGNSFKYVTVIDTNREIIDDLNIKSHILHNYISLKKIHGSLLDINLKKNDFDLTLLSHVLYYIPHTKWLNAIIDAYNATSPGGFLFIVLSGDEFDKSSLIKHFGGQPIPINRLAYQCQEFFGKNCVKIFSSKSLITTASLLPMLHIAGLFLHDVGITAEKHKLISYIEEHHKKNNNLYEINSQQKFIVIKKIRS